MSDNHQAVVPAQAQYPPQEGEIQPGVRLVPNSPTGTGGQLTAVQMAELGAMLGALGAEKGASAAILEFLQTVTMQVWIQQLPMLVAKLQGWEKARFQRLYAAVRLMPEAPTAASQGLIQRIMGPQPQPVMNSYVDRNEVLRLITQAMSEAPAV